MPGTPAVTLNSIINRFNNWNGVYIESEGVVTINYSWSTSNGWDGFKVLTGGNVFFNNTAAIMNGLAGIEVVTNPPATLRLANATWFGNVRNDPGHTYRNLMYNCLLNIL